MATEYTEEYERRARWGIVLGLIILLVGLVFGPSAPISKEDFNKLSTDVSKLSTKDDLKAKSDEISKKIDTQFADLSKKLDAVAKATALEEQVGKVLKGLDETKAKLEAASQDTSQKLEALSSEISALAATLKQLQKSVTLLETSFAEKLQGSMLLKTELSDDQKDPEGKPTCAGTSWLIQLLNEQDAIRLKEMGIDNDGNGIVCLAFSVISPAAPLQSP